MDSKADAQVKFLARGSSYTVFLTASEAVLALQKTAGRDQHKGQATVRMKLADASRHVRVCRGRRCYRMR